MHAGSEALEQSRSKADNDKSTNLELHAQPELFRRSLMPAAAHATSEQRPYLHDWSADAAKQVPNVQPEGAQANMNSPYFENTGSLLSDLTTGPAELQRLAGVLMSSGGSSQEESRTWQNWMAALNAAVQQAQILVRTSSCKPASAATLYQMCCW